VTSPASEGILIVIPAYNEERNIKRVVESVIKEGFSTLVVDDGSDDKTSECARTAGAEVIRFDENQGKGKALRRGFEYANETGYEAVAVIDGDGQHNVSELKNLISAFGENGIDIVIGSRMTDLRNMPFIRRLTNKVMSKIVSLLAKNRITDSQSGFRIIKTTVLKNITLTTSNYDTESEMLIRAGRKGYTIKEIPISTIYGMGEKSSIRPIRDTYRFIKLVIRCLVK
jgi:glycosyltransferase involved in cell wall biosynthesis